MKLYKILMQDVDEYNQPCVIDLEKIFTDKYIASEYCDEYNIEWEQFLVQEFESDDYKRKENK